MSLQVWLPLNGALTNNGLNSIKPTIVPGQTAFGTDYGKITSAAYKWSADGQGISLDGFMNAFSTYSKYTISAWVRYTATATNHSAAICSSGDWNDGAGQMCFALYSYNGSGYTTLLVPNRTNWADGIILSSPLVANQWYHIAITYDGSTTRAYINGTYVGHYSGGGVTGASQTSNLYIGRATYYDGFTIKGSINDFRIYDDVISVKEIKEISKGLAAHYQLKPTQITNYAKNVGLTIYNNYDVAASLTQLDEHFMGYPVCRLTMTPTSDNVSSFQTDLGSHGVYQASWTFNANTKYCYWIYYRPISHNDVRVGGVASNIHGWTEIAPHYVGDGWYRVGQYRDGSVSSSPYDSIFTSFKTPSAAANVPITIDFCAPHLIAGSSDIIETYDAITNDDNKVHDVSGYGNHLNIIGALAANGFSPRYGQCVDFNQTGYLKKTDFNMITNEFTITFWLNPPYSINSQHFICGTFDSWTGNGFGIWRDNTGGGYSSIYKSNSEGSYTGFPSLDVTHDAWNHIAYVYTGRQGIIYKNGVEVARVDGGSSGTVSHPVLYLGNSMYSEVASQTDEASMSDFRFYTTALSASDIEGLYKHGASISKDGALFAYDFNEFNPNAKSSVDKDGTVSSCGLNTKIAPIYDMKTKTLEDGSAWARIHHLDLNYDKTCFADAAEVAKCGKNNRYSRMGDVDKFKSQPSLPDGYTELEYIESSGTQYIDTGVVYSSLKNFKTKMRFSYNTVAPANQIHGFTGNRGMGIGTSGATWWECSSPASVSVDTLYEIEWILNNTDNGYYNRIINGNHNAGNGGGGHSGYHGNMYLFTAHESGSASGFIPSYMCSSKLYYAQIYENDVMVRNFVPCKNPSGVVGLYDLIENQFYSNAGTGSFAAGDYVNKYEFMLTYGNQCNNAEYTQLDYIESTGTQYIDTGFVPNQNTRIKTRFSTANMGNDSFYVYGSGIDSSNSAFELYPWDNTLEFNYGWDGRFVGAAAVNKIITTDQNKNVSTFTIDGTTHSATHNTQTFTTPYTLTLFALHRAKIITSNSGFKLYSCQIYDNGTIVRDFIPCINCHGKVGLYDTVTKKFFTNDGSGDFISGPAAYNRWTQTSSPNDSSVTGYTPINIAWPDHSYGIRKHGSSSLYNCDTGGTWYAPIGQTQLWEGGIPAADGTMQLQTELWVRVDKSADATQTKIYNGAIVASDFIEI